MELFWNNLAIFYKTKLVEPSNYTLHIYLREMKTHAHKRKINLWLPEIRNVDRVGEVWLVIMKASCVGSFWFWNRALS
jgi:hypothetical protein